MLRADPLHFTALKWMGVSAAHFEYAYRNPIEPTPPMIFGTLVHDIVLGGDGFVIWPGERRAGKEWDAFKVEHEGKLIVKRDEFARAEQAALAVLENPDARRLIETSAKESQWETDMFGRRCRGRIDLRGLDTSELKVTASVEPGKFMRHANRMAWPEQIAWYQEARRMLGEDPGEGFIIAVEPKPPHVVTVFRLKPKRLEDGLKLCRLWVEQLQQCEESQVWPGYVSSIVDFEATEDIGIEFDDAEAA